MSPEFAIASLFVSCVKFKRISSVKWSALAHLVITQEISVQELDDTRTDIFLSYY